MACECGDTILRDNTSGPRNIRGEAIISFRMIENDTAVAGAENDSRSVNLTRRSRRQSRAGAYVQNASGTRRRRDDNRVGRKRAAASHVD
ncbi:hypothetical protein D3C87_1677240 [compost metagenome]